MEKCIGSNCRRKEDGVFRLLNWRRGRGKGRRSSPRAEGRRK